MKKKILISGLLLTFIVLVSKGFLEKTEVQKTQEQYAKTRKNHPFSKTLELSKEERKARGIPPNKYYEEKYLLEINPYTGRTHPENVYSLREELKKKASSDLLETELIIIGKKEALIM